MRKTRPQPPSSPQITVRAKPGHPQRAIVTVGSLSFPAAIGRNGRTALKREGDGKTPIAAMRLLSGFMRSERVRAPGTTLPMKPIRNDMLWCDAPANANYNRLVKAPFKASHEVLTRSDGLYDVCLVLDWNVTSRRRNLGSAIFFHLIRPGYRPTDGCIAVHPRDMRRLLPLIRAGTVVKVV